MRLKNKLKMKVLFVWDNSIANRNQYINTLKKWTKQNTKISDQKKL